MYKRGNCVFSLLFLEDVNSMKSKIFKIFFVENKMPHNTNVTSKS